MSLCHFGRPLHLLHPLHTPTCARCPCHAQRTSGLGMYEDGDALAFEVL